MKNSSIILPQKNMPVAGEYDVAVAGGGAAGLAAAITAARLGAKVALIENEGMLGGNAGIGGVSTICGMHVLDAEGALKPIIGGIAAEFVQRLTQSGATMGPIPFKGSSTILSHPWPFARLADEMVMAETNIDLYLHARVISVSGEDGKPSGLVFHQVGGLRAISASVIIDATGDADVARMAGANVRRSERIMYPSTMFFMANIGQSEESGRARLMFAKTLQDHWDDPEYKITRKEGMLIPTGRPKEVAVSVTRVSTGGRDDPAADASDPDQLTKAEIEGRRQVDEMARFIKNKVAGFENAYVSAVSPKMGIRETKTIEGEYTLTAQDVLGGGRFPDAVAANSWPIEDHAPGGVTLWKEIPPGKYYQVPYRCLLPAGVDGVLVAGRCMSATHEALASARTISLCMATGQAAGTAAYMAATKKISPRKVDTENLQGTLIDNGAILEL